MTVRSRLSQPLKLWHAITVAVSAGALLVAAAKWAGMPAWGPAVAEAQLIRRIDSIAQVQQQRDSMQDLVSMTIDARQKAGTDSVRRDLSELKDITSGVLSGVCALLPERDQRMARIAKRCP